MEVGCMTSLFVVWATIALVERYLCGRGWLGAMLFAAEVTLLTPVFGIGLVIWVRHLLKECR